ncbi:MAG: hypothetical protein PPHEMADE_0422, partial [uncultured Paraburkholderia sp.]
MVDYNNYIAVDWTKSDRGWFFLLARVAAEGVAAEGVARRAMRAANSKESAMTQEQKVIRAKVGI